MASTTRKISCSLPFDLVDDLDHISAKLGLSRSALMSGFLLEGVSAVGKLLTDVDPNDDPEVVRRAVSGALDDIVSELKELQEHVGIEH